MASPAVRPELIADRVTYRLCGPLTDAELDQNTFTRARALAVDFNRDTYRLR